MSLINDMLRDLDTRNAATAERSGLAHNVRALPGTPERRLNPLWLALGAAALGGGMVWLLLRPPTSPVATDISPPVAVRATPAVTESTADAATIADEATVAEPNAEAPPVTRNEAPAPLRLDTQISTPVPSPEPTPSPAKPVADSPASAPALFVTAPKAAAAPPAPPAPPPPQAAPPARTVESASRSNAPPQISKQPVNAGTVAEQAEAEYRRALGALKRGDNAEGNEALRSTLRLLPTHVGARQALLGLLSEQQRWADVETLALDGVGTVPQRSDWALLAARIMYERNEPEQALETLNQNAAAGRLNADYQILHALLLQRAGRHADAANCYRTALALRPNEGRWWYGLARALDADKREAEARQAYEKARDSGNLPPELLQAVERRLR